MTCPLDALNHELAFKPPEEALNHDGLQKELIEFLIQLPSWQLQRLPCLSGFKVDLNILCGFFFFSQINFHDILQKYFLLSLVQYLFSAYYVSGRILGFELL